MVHPDLLDRIPVSENQKAALLFAFYIPLYLLFWVFGIFAIYQVLYMFLLPILWAILVGTILFPFKRNLSDRLKGWLDSLGHEGSPLLVGFILLPFQAAKNISDYIFDTALSSTGFYCIVGYIILKILCFEDIFLRLLSWFGSFYSTVDSSIQYFTHKWVVILLILYSVAFVSWIIVQETSHIHKKFARSLSLPIWIFFIANIANVFGPFRVIIFTAVIILLSLISLGIVGNDVGNTPETSEIEKNEITTSEEFNEGDLLPKPIDDEFNDTDEAFGRSLSGDAHLRIIGGLCMLLWTVHYNFLLILIFIPFSIAASIKFGERIGVFNVLFHLLDVAWRAIEETVNKVVNIVVAGFLRKFVKLLFTSDRLVGFLFTKILIVFMTSLITKVDLISSISVMAALAIGLLFFVFFTAFQLHNETVHLIKLGGNVVSSNPDWMKYALNYTEGQLGEHDIDHYIEQAYQQGRTWLASNVRSLADPKDVSRADQLEEQLVDNLYRMWIERNNELNATTKSVYTSRARSSDWMTQLLSTSNLNTLKGELTNVITENIETVFSIMQSLWTVIVMNISILQTMIGAMISLIFGFGFELMNFFIEFIVFLTAVYYLLASSDEQYIPLKLISEFLPSSHAALIDTSTNSGCGSFNGNNLPNIALAFENAISGVFVLSSKMSIFYGFYTYFVHSLFDLNIVFVPSMLAAIFAAIPIMPSYIVGIFGFFEIFLVRGDTIAGIVFALASIAPLFFADAAFYKELKGSHPYVTGLAVIGGMYWLGLQGAIFGPIILCCVIALFNLYNEFAKCR